MTDRKKLGKELTAAMHDLNEDIYIYHRIGSREFGFINKQCLEFRDRLCGIRSLAKLYLAFAPEMRPTYESDLRELEQAITSYEFSLSDASPPRVHTRSNERVSVRDEVLPVMRDIGTIFYRPVTVGHAHQKVVQTFDKRGRPKSTHIYSRNAYGKRYWR